MKAIAHVLKGIFVGATSNREDIYREWDRQRQRAISPSERAEIDAIFSRAL